jgi:aspartate ammonia-lyase
VGIVTALTPQLGYAAAADIAKAALAGDGMVRELVLATGLVEASQLDALLHPERLAGLSVVTPPTTL